MRKLALLALTGLGGSLVFAETQTLTLQKGWNLKGTYLNNIPTDKFFNKEGIKTIWSWINNKWYVWSPNAKLMEIIQKYVKEDKLGGILNSLKAGQGFWIQAENILKITIEGIKAKDSKLKLSQGWNLIALKTNKTIKIEDLLKNDITKSSIKTIWKWNNGKWAVYSPIPALQEVIQKYIQEGKLLPLTEIKSGEGFWVQVKNPIEINTGNEETLETPPQVGFAYLLKDKLNAVPLANADVYIDGKKVGKTDQFGQFSLEGVQDGAKVIVKKAGVTIGYGIVKNGQVVILTQKNTSPEVPLTVSKQVGSQKPAPKVITSFDGSVVTVIDTYTVNKDITISVVPIFTPSVVPSINDNTLDSSSFGNDKVKANQLAIIGGALFNIKDANKNILDISEIEINNLKFKIKAFKFIGDLETLLNGGFSDKYQEFSNKVFNQFKELQDKGIIDLFVLQYIDGKWVYKGKASLKEIKVKKKNNGKIQEVTKYMIETPVLDNFAPTVFALKLNYIIGKTTVCVKEGGFKMFDGSIITSPDSNSEKFEWVGKPISLVTLIGDEYVQNSPILTDENGCAVIKYKVPFINPIFTIALKKKGYFDNSITCEVTANGAKCDEGILYRIPDTASIEGYVYNKITKEGISNALVTLVNPEILTANKVKIGENNGKSYIKLEYKPNISYKWTLIKYDDGGNKVAEINLKEGQGDPKYAQLTEDEILDKLIKPLDNGQTPPVAPKNLLGKWELHIKATHVFTNTDTKIVEEGIATFDVDVLMTKLAEIMGGQLSEKQSEVVVGENGTLQEVPSLKNAAIYGGPSIGFLYEYGAQLDGFEWRTQLLGGGEEGKTECIDDPIANDLGICYISITNDTLIYKKALYPTILNVKFIAKHFADLLKPDPACEGDSECEGQPFIKTGFTIRNLFTGWVEVPLKNGSTQKVTKYIASYVDVPYDLNRKITNLVDITKFNFVAPSVTAYMRQIFTDKEGHYQINLIPPELTGKLEIFAKAEGYKFDKSTDIKLVNDLEAGKVSHYDLYLEPVNATNSKPVVETLKDWKGWDFSKASCSVKDVKWQVVENPVSIKVANSEWAELVWGDSNISLLPDIDSETKGYLWFGDNKTGLYSDTGQNDSSAPVCGQVITPVFDLSKMSFPVLKFKTWFEVESVDVAKGQFDQMEIGFILPKEENGNVDKITIYTATGQTLELYTDTYYSIDVLNPESESVVQEPNVPYSNQGPNALPVWIDVSIPIEYLAGYKVKFVFKFDSKDTLFNGFRGWGIDSVKVVDDMESNLIEEPPMPINIK